MLVNLDAIVDSIPSGVYVEYKSFEREQDEFRRRLSMSGNGRLAFLERARVALDHVGNQRNNTYSDESIVSDHRWQMQKENGSSSAGQHLPGNDELSLVVPGGYYDSAIIGCFDPTGSRHPSVDPRAVLPVVSEALWNSPELGSKAVLIN